MLSEMAERTGKELSSKSTELTSGATRRGFIGESVPLDRAEPSSLKSIRGVRAVSRQQVQYPPGSPFTKRKSLSRLHPAVVFLDTTDSVKQLRYPKVHDK
jgi:hypothetical protein